MKKYNELAPAEKLKYNQRRPFRIAEIRDQLIEHSHLNDYVRTIKKIDDLDPSDELFKNKLDKYRASNDQRIRLINKFLPDLKSVDADITSNGESIAAITIIPPKILYNNIIESSGEDPQDSIENLDSDEIYGE